MHFEGLPPGSVTPGMPPDVLYAVTEIYPSHVVLDGNHPLAGMALRLKLKVRDVREASDDEIAAGTLGTAGITVLNTAPPSTPTH
jgi:FKBP-type peptidyl-prolyl cis-trans isomerase SlyD